MTVNVNGKGSAELFYKINQSGKSPSQGPDIMGKSFIRDILRRPSKHTSKKEKHLRIQFKKLV